MSDRLVPTEEQAQAVSLAVAGRHLAIEAYAGTGKALAADEPVLTPAGWVPIGSLNVGDLVASDDGRFHRVTGVHRQGVRSLFDVVLSNRTVIRATADHLWLAQSHVDRQNHRLFRVVSTEKMAERVKVRCSTGWRAGWFLPMAAPIELPEVDFPVHPWVLGVLVGDGCLPVDGCLTIMNPERDLMKRLDSLLPDGLTPRGETSTYAVRVRHVGPRLSAFKVALRQCGVLGSLSYQKVIAERLMFGSIAQRSELLTGLFDTDGSPAGPGAVEFTSTSEGLCVQVKWLTESLGGTATMSDSRVTFFGDSKGVKRPGRPSWRVTCKLPTEFGCPFTSEQKSARYRPANQRPPYRAVESITPAGEGEAVCISVDAPSRLFLTRSCVPTHNSATLAMIAEAKPSRGLYVAFNRRIVEDVAGRLPDTVEARTSHSLAYGAVGHWYAHRIFDAPRMRSSQIAKVLGIDPVVIHLPTGDQRLSPGFLAGVVVKAVRRFCQTADTEPSRWHVPFPETMRSTSELAAQWDLVREALEPALVRAWSDAADPAGVLPLTPDHYFKVWCLQEPRLEWDYLLVDECQDSNGALLGVVESQRDHAQLVYVGDVFQSIYGWRGAVNAMAEADVDDRTFLTHCQPAGTMVRQALQVNGREWQHRDVPIETLAVGDTVASWYRRGVRRECQPITDIAVRNYDGPLVVAQADGHTSRYAPNHECVVVLGDLTQGDQVVYMMRKGNQYRIGRCPWKYGNGHGPIRRAVREGAEAVWVLSVHETVEQAALHEALAQTRFGIPGAGWREDADYKMPLDEFWAKIGDNGQQAVACLVAHRLLPDMPLWTRGDRPGGGWSTQLVTAAANVRSGMRMAVVDSMTGSTNGAPGSFVPWSAWTPVEIKTEWHSGPIYSLSVAVDHTYIGDGIVTHNSFRFGPEVASVANRVLGEMGAPKPLVGLGASGSVGPVEHPEVVLSRTNAAAVRRALQEIDDFGRPHIVGGARDVVAFARGALSLMEEGWSPHPELACFGSWGDVFDYAKADELGSDLSLLVRLVEEFGAGRIVESFEDQAPVHRSTLVLSTAHAAKGLEWGSVQIADDFPADMDATADEGKRLLYVAVTRARSELDVSRVGALR